MNEENVKTEGLRCAKGGRNIDNGKKGGEKKG